MTIPLDAPDEQTRALDLLVALGDDTIVRQSWAPDGTGAQPGGVVGGDGAGESISLRYINRYAPNAQITAHYYVVDEVEAGNLDDDNGPLFGVGMMVEFAVLDGPVGEPDSEVVWSEPEFDNLSEIYLSEREAEAARDALVRQDKPSDYRWIGQANQR
jgi:hypothetical protein